MRLIGAKRRMQNTVVEFIEGSQTWLRTLHSSNRYFDGFSETIPIFFVADPISTSVL